VLLQLCCYDGKADHNSKLLLPLFMTLCVVTKATSVRSRAERGNEGSVPFCQATFKVRCSKFDVGSSAYKTFNQALIHHYLIPYPDIISLKPSLVHLEGVKERPGGRVSPPVVIRLHLLDADNDSVGVYEGD